MEERQLLLRVLERRVKAAAPEQRLQWAKQWLARFDVNVWRPTLFEWGAHPSSPLVELIGASGGGGDVVIHVPHSSVEGAPGFWEAAGSVRRALKLIDDGAVLAACSELDAAAVALARDWDDLRARVDDTGGFSDA